MIAKATRGASPRAIARYLHGEGTRQEHSFIDADGARRSGGVVIGGNLAHTGTTDGRGWARSMGRIIKRYGDEVARPVYQVSLSLAPDDPGLNVAAWRAAATTWMETQDCAEQPWVLVQHDERHVHLVVSRVGFDRKLWHARQDYRRNEQACRRIETEQHLTPVASSHDKPKRQPLVG